MRGDFHVDIDTNLTHLMDVLPNVRGTFVYLSSWFCYGDRHGACVSPYMDAHEDDPCRPTGFYSITKLAAEQLIKSYCETVGQGPSSYRILRLCNVIGNDPRAGKQKNALEYLLRRLVNDEPVQIYEGDNYRNYLHVDDVVRAIHLCLIKGELNSIYNIGAPESVRLIDLIEHARDRLGSISSITRVPVPPFHKIVQVPDFWMNTDKVKALGFTPETDAFGAVDKVLVDILRGEALDKVKGYADHTS
jgi:nucleoside-diphosphate-sugar epimerase